MNPIDMLPTAITENDSIAIKRSRLVFAAALLFVASQIFTIPLYAIGPWAAWPTAPDIMSAILLSAWILACGWQWTVNSYSKRILWVLILLLWGMLLSLSLMTLLSAHLGWSPPTDRGSLESALFAIGKFIHSLAMFGILATLPWSERRGALVRQVTSMVLLGVVFLVAMTYFEILGTDLLGSHLPSSDSIAGAWGWYNQGVLTGEGVGGVGYNHAYTALQILLLLAFVRQLGPTRMSPTDYLMLVMATGGIVLSGSRAGVVGLLVYLSLSLLGSSVREKLIIGMLAGSAAAAITVWSRGRLFDLEITQRILSLADAARGKSETLSGRDSLWNAAISAIFESPGTLLFGHGLGRTSELLGDNAHSFLLQVWIELGAAGVLMISSAMVGLLVVLSRTSPSNKSLLYASIAFLVTAATQETFYPVPAMGGFLVLYLSVISFSISNTKPCSPVASIKPSTTLDMRNSAPSIGAVVPSKQHFLFLSRD